MGTSTKLMKSKQPHVVAVLRTRCGCERRVYDMPYPPMNELRVPLRMKRLYVTEADQILMDTSVAGEIRVFKLYAVAPRKFSDDTMVTLFYDED